MEKENNTATVRTHRVGAFTSGFCMVGFGAMLLLHNLLDVMDYEIILGLWPLILIGMGVELLLSNVFKSKIVYDKAAIVLLFVMTLLVMVLAGADVCIEASKVYWNIGI
ncbi:MAG: hypothetical protein IKT67_03435 [Lachnospiraceae bacterium]|nr:hypothetical protein [Lachnospiraceae bacterium]